MTRTSVGRTRSGLLFLVLSLITVQLEAQSRLDLSATFGVGYFTPEFASPDQGRGLQLSLGYRLSPTLALAPQLGYLKGDNQQVSFLTIGPELRWTPPAQRTIHLSAGVGIGTERKPVGSDLPLLQAAGVASIHATRESSRANTITTNSIVGTLGVGLTLPTTGWLQPMLQVRVTSSLVGLEGSEAVGATNYGNATLFTVGIGLRFGKR